VRIPQKRSHSTAIWNQFKTQKLEKAYVKSPKHNPRLGKQEQALNIETLRATDTERLYELLKLPTPLPVASIERILGVLISERNERPNSRHFSALLRSCCSAEEGSNLLIRRYLEDMDALGIELDSTLCHDALEVC
jgi:hypothetical protein